MEAKHGQKRSFACCMRLRCLGALPRTFEEQPFWYTFPSPRASVTHCLRNPHQIHICSIKTFEPWMKDYRRIESRPLLAAWGGCPRCCCCQHQRERTLVIGLANDTMGLTKARDLRCAAGCVRWVVLIHSTRGAVAHHCLYREISCSCVIRAQPCIELPALTKWSYHSPYTTCGCMI